MDFLRFCHHVMYFMTELRLVDVPRYENSYNRILCLQKNRRPEYRRSCTMNAQLLNVKVQNSNKIEWKIRLQKNIETIS